MFKPELLLPAGSTETFFAAMDGGADAVYLGFKKFNARNRAKNFSNNDIANVIKEAHSRHKKVYITLNTLLKNAELHELIDTINVISQCNPDAVIVQDFAVIQLIRKFFKNLKIHASTQMSSHNSASASFFKNCGVERIILPRELTEKELRLIATRSALPIEIFVHGALCYSFSGQCLFSSYLGGNSANRGMCAQVCRRGFKSGNEKSTLFSLRDFQLIDYVPLFSELKIASLKVEGRMKNAEYVYNTARAYRMAIDDHSRIEEAKEILNFDFAREKTSWFMGKDLRGAIAQNQGTGIFAGKIISVDKQGFLLQSQVELKPGYQLRIRNFSDSDSGFIRITAVKDVNDACFVSCSTDGVSVGDEVYLSGTDSYKLISSFPDYIRYNFRQILPKQAETLKASFSLPAFKNRETQIFLRISDLAQLQSVKLRDFEAIFLKLPFTKLEKLNAANIPADIKSKIRIELPKFISETRLNAFRKTINALFSAGWKSFVLGHISQIDLLPAGAKISSSENVFLLNDLAVSFINQHGIRDYCYPLENDYPNMLVGRDRGGIVPVYFHPELFYSRMPVKSGKLLSDDNGKKYAKSVYNGFTIITDITPVSFTHNISKFKSKGFFKFLIDFSYEKDINKLPSILKAYRESSKIVGSVDFNMKKELH